MFVHRLVPSRAFSKLRAASFKSVVSRFASAVVSGVASPDRRDRALCVSASPAMCCRYASKQTRFNAHPSALEQGARSSAPIAGPLLSLFALRSASIARDSRSASALCSWAACVVQAASRRRAKPPATSALANGRSTLCRYLQLGQLAEIDERPCARAGICGAGWGGRRVRSHAREPRR